MKKQIFLQNMFSERKNSDIDKLVNDALKAEPDYFLPDNFADMVAEKVAEKFAWQQYVLEFLIYFGVVIGLAAVVVAMQFIFFGAQWQNWLHFITENIFVIAGISLLTVFVLFTDKVLLKYFLYRSAHSKELI